MASCSAVRSGCRYSGGAKMLGQALGNKSVYFDCKEKVIKVSLKLGFKLRGKEAESHGRRMKGGVTNLNLPKMD
jgi:hypothetical protein